MVGAYELSFIFLPLAALGAQALWDLLKSGRQRQDLWRTLLAAALLGVILATVFGTVGFEVKQYLTRGVFFSAALLVLACVTRWPKRVRNGLAIACFLALLVNDSRALNVYIKEFAGPITFAS